MTTTLKYRTDIKHTLDSLEEEIREDNGNATDQDVALSDLRFDLSEGTPTIVVGKTEIPATPEGLLKIADQFRIPKPFFKRVGREMGLSAQKTILDLALDHEKSSAIGMRYNDQRVVSVYNPGRPPVDPLRLTAIAKKVLGGNAPIQRLVNETGEFSFDAHAPFNGSSGVYGDRDSLVEVPDALTEYSWATGIQADQQSRVQDLTAAGLRFGVDLSQGLAPWLQPWAMRLVCTNGMSTHDDGLKVDARGSTMDEVLAELEAMAERAFARQERQIDNLYRLREERVTDVTGTINRLAREQNLSARVRMNLIDQAPALAEDATMFDLANMVTNMANAENAAGGLRLQLETAGGGIVNTESARCDHCHQTI